MELKRRLFIAVLLLAALAYPMYEAIHVALSGGAGDHCVNQAYTKSGGGIGFFCEWGPGLGGFLFGESRAYLGYSLLLGLTTLGFGVFAFWLSMGKPAQRE